MALCNNKFTPFIWLVGTGASILMGSALQIAMLLIWISSVANIDGLIFIQMVFGIILPLVNAAIVIFCIGGCGCCCTCGCNNGVCAEICKRLTIGLIGVFHLFGWHSGYIFGPLLLILASLMPLADATTTAVTAVPRSAYSELAVITIPS